MGRVLDCATIFPLRPDYWTNCSVVGIPVIRTKYREIRLELASFGANSRYETLASLGSTTLQDPTSSRCGHTGTETMGPLTLDITWLIGSLHDCLLRTDGRFYSSRAIWSSISVCLIPHTAFRSNSCCWGSLGGSPIHDEYLFFD